MDGLTVSQDSHAGMTMLSNRFIDEYMKDANDAQMKIYLYLLRCAGTNLPSGISAIADHFNYTEKDILRALQYWDKRHVISLLYDESHELVGIRLENLDARPAEIISMPVAPLTVSQASSVILPVSPASAPAKTAPVSSFDRNSVSLDQLKEFKNREETSQLLFIVEQYLGKPLSSGDIRSIYFMTDILHFSMDLIDYLVQYCVERGKKDFRYMEKVAINWAQHDVSTPKQAAAYAVKYDKNVYTVMNTLGKTSAPTNREASYIHKWFREYGFTLDVVLEACGRSVLATDKHRLEYADGILQSWHTDGVRSLADVRTADAAFQKKKTARPEKQPASSNPFHQFKQNQYDYNELLQKIKIN